MAKGELHPTKLAIVSLRMHISGEGSCRALIQSGNSSEEYKKFGY